MKSIDLGVLSFIVLMIVTPNEADTPLARFNFNTFVGGTCECTTGETQTVPGPALVYVKHTKFNANTSATCIFFGLAITVTLDIEISDCSVGEIATVESPVSSFSYGVVQALAACLKLCPDGYKSTKLYIGYTYFFLCWENEAVVKLMVLCVGNTKILSVGYVTMATELPINPYELI